MMAPDDGAKTCTRPLKYGDVHVEFGNSVNTLPWTGGELAAAVPSSRMIAQPVPEVFTTVAATRLDVTGMVATRNQLAYGPLFGQLEPIVGSVGRLAL